MDSVKNLYWSHENSIRNINTGIYNDILIEKQFSEGIFIHFLLFKSIIYLVIPGTIDETFYHCVEK